MQIDLLKSDDSKVHAINCTIEDAALEAGILCLVSYNDATTRICNENHCFLVELPSEVRSSHERVKAFNVVLNILSHEQVQLSS
jgi:hypothetical protein